MQPQLSEPILVFAVTGAMSQIDKHISDRQEHKTLKLHFQSPTLKLCYHFLSRIMGWKIHLKYLQKHP